MLLRVIGWLLLMEAGFMAIPLISSLFFDRTETMPFLISMVITAAAGGIFMSLRSDNHDMGQREAIVLTGLTWVVLSLFGMLPFLLCRTHFGITDAFFETMSGFTTTGASVMGTLTDVPRGILLWRCIIQWIGGLGIILFTLAVVPMLNNQGGIKLFNAEVTGITHDKLRPRVGYTAKSLWLIYIVLTVTLVILLAFSDMDFFDAVCYGLSTMSTGGFATTDMTLGQWATLYVKIVFILFMFIGGVNFALLYKTVTGKAGSLWKSDAFRWYLGLIGVAYALFCISIIIYGKVDSVIDVTIDPLFQAVSVISSTGIMEADFGSWGPLSVVVLLVLMFVGACAGSTSGGAKIDRIVVLLRFLKNEFYKMMHPKAVTTVIINGKGTSTPVVSKVLAFLFLYGLVIIVGTIALALLDVPLIESIFRCLSAISNTGLDTGQATSFAMMPDAAKWLLALIMLTGRLELYTILLLFTPWFWRK